MDSAVSTPTRVAPSRWVRWRRRAEASTMYVPVLLMGLLALGSYWLMRVTPAVAPAAAPRPVAHDPTDVMRGFAVRSYRMDGQLRSEVQGTEGRQFPDDKSLEVDQPRIRHFADDGVRYVAQASKAWLNGGHNRAVLTGQAVVVREPPTGHEEPPLTFQGNHLVLDSDARTLVSEEPVLLLRGRSRIQADRMTYVEATRVAEFSGRVRAILDPRLSR